MGYCRQGTGDSGPPRVCQMDTTYEPRAARPLICCIITDDG